MNLPSVLVIDDEAHNFDVIEMLLSDQDYQLHYAANGQKAIASLDLYQPDVILLDVMMPVMDGMEVCKQIKVLPQWEHIPIIMVTALNSKEDLARCLETGADDFISKPVNGIELRARVKSMLRINQQYLRIKELYRLQEQNIELLKANLDQLCGNLLLTLPHELNTPLNGVVGIIELLANGHQDMNPSDLHKWLSIAQHSALRLEQFTQRFLQYAQLEILTSQSSLSEAKTISPAKLATHLVIETAIKAKAESVSRSQDLQWSLAKGDLSITSQDLLSIIDELLENAFKFSKPGTLVKVTSQLINDIFYLAIADQGRGMTPEQITQIGTFSQFDRQKYGQQGIGLGLKIVQKIVENQGGKFAISSIYQQGTTVEIELPLI
jgi:DNA-binding response OmpR family regulator